MPPIRRVSANAISALKEALTAAFWYRGDLYRYAKAAVGGEALFLAGIEWTDQYKRDSVDAFVDRLVHHQDEHQEKLLAVMVDVANMTEFPQLARVDDPQPKIDAAKEAVARLKQVVEPYEQELAKQQASRERFDAARVAAQQQRATEARLQEIKAQYIEIMGMEPQPRGFALEKLLHDVFEAFDLDPHHSFRIEGEQIDGGFVLGGEYFLLEAKWQKALTGRDDLDIFKSKVERRSENTLGLFISVEGFEPTAVEKHTGYRSPIMLMDGGDLYAVLDGRIELPDLLTRKRRETSMSGKVLLTVNEILGGP